MTLELVTGAVSSAVPVKTLLGKTLLGWNVDDPLPDAAPITPRQHQTPVRPAAGLGSESGGRACRSRC
jgi:hypothetical protein